MKRQSTKDKKGISKINKRMGARLSTKEQQLDFSEKQ